MITTIALILLIIYVLITIPLINDLGKQVLELRNTANEMETGLIRKNTKLRLANVDKYAAIYALDRFIELASKSTFKKLEKEGLIDYKEGKNGFKVNISDTEIKYSFSNKTKKARVTTKKTK